MDSPLLPRVPRTVGGRFRRALKVLFYCASLSAAGILLLDAYAPGFFGPSLPAEPREAAPAPEPELPPPPIARVDGVSPAYVEPVRSVRDSSKLVQSADTPARRASPAQRPADGPIARPAEPDSKFSILEWLNPRRDLGRYFKPFRKGGGQSPPSALPSEARLETMISEGARALSGGDSEIPPEIPAVELEPGGVGQVVPPSTGRPEDDNLFPPLQRGTLTPDQARLRAAMWARIEKERRLRILLKKLGYGAAFTAVSFALIFLLSGLVKAVLRLKPPPQV